MGGGVGGGVGKSLGYGSIVTITGVWYDKRIMGETMPMID